MKKIITIILLTIVWVTNVHAVKWKKLQDNKHARLMFDKQSVIESGKYQKAWVKIKYKTLQTNI
ncbi:MAG: carbonic anhydrase [Methylophilaceae bacterium]|jgi:carbonic anhydrase